VTAEASLFQTTLSKSVAWVDEMRAQLALRDPHLALHALRAGLHALRDRLPPGEAVDLGAQLPMLIRGLYYEGWRLAGRPERPRNVEELCAAVRADLDDPRLDPQDVLHATIRLLAAHVTGGEIDDVLHVLPGPISAFLSDALA